MTGVIIRTTSTQQQQQPSPLTHSLSLSLDTSGFFFTCKKNISWLIVPSFIGIIRQRFLFIPDTLQYGYHVNTTVLHYLTVSAQSKTMLQGKWLLKHRFVQHEIRKKHHKKKKKRDLATPGMVCSNKNKIKKRFRLCSSTGEVTLLKSW